MIAPSYRPAGTPAERMADLILQGVDGAPVGICLTDTEEGRFLYVNDAMCRLLGRSREELLRLTILDVMRPEDHSAARTAHQAMLNGEVATHHAERSYPRPDRSSVWAVIRVVPVHGSDGAIEAFFSHLVDVTERKLREERLASYTSDAAWLGRIRDAIDDSRLLLYAQPIVDLRSGETVQRELLLRMRDEQGQIVAPGAFLPVAERYGLIAEIDRWVIRQAAKLAAQGMHVEFNLSAASIGNSDVIREIQTQLHRDTVDPSLLVVEITETAMLDHPQHTRALGEQLAALGCGLALDDFGTGFATLSMLKQLPAQYLKIDREFVRAVADDETDQRLVRAVVNLAREFGMATIAEGVEDLRTMTTLTALGVDCAQGYLFAEPAPLVDPATHRPVPLEVGLADGSDRVAIVRAAIDAVLSRDLEKAKRLTHPSLVLRPLWTDVAADPDGAYRGHEGLARYFSVIPELTEQFDFRTESVWDVGDAVIVFGKLIAATESLRVIDTMAVYRLRDGLIVSAQRFEQPDLERAPITQNEW